LVRLPRASLLAFAAAAFVLVGIKLLFATYPGDYPVKDQAEAFTWTFVIGVIAFGLAGLFADRSLSNEDAFPEPFGDSARAREGLLVAVATGAAYGIVTILQDLPAPGSGNPLNLTDWPHVPWPWSMPFYTFGAIFLEFMLRLGALCILVWIIHVVILRRRWLMPVFWVVNVIVATYEIMPATLESISANAWLEVARTPIEPLFFTNVFEGWLLLRYGWLSPIAFRLSFYLFWHVIYGGLGPF
jgi:hypothetical protein